MKNKIVVLPGSTVCPGMTSQTTTLTDTAEVPDLRGKKIIVAEDDPNGYVIVHYLLKKTGAEIFHVENGLELLEMLKDINPDLILMDISMPEMNGHDCLKTIRKNPAIRSRVIMQSAYSIQEQLDHPAESGADGYLMKPVRKEDLYPLLRSVIKD